MVLALNLQEVTNKTYLYKKETNKKWTISFLTINVIVAVESQQSTFATTANNVKTLMFAKLAIQYVSYTTSTVSKRLTGS